jgi:hypothetical protein
VTGQLRFTQLEFSHAIGVPAGLYPVGDGSVLAVAVTAAVEVRWRRRRRRTVVDATAPAPVALTLVTHVASDEPPRSPSEADAALAALRRDDAAQDALRDAALRLLNRAIVAARRASGDPYLVELTAVDPRAVRFGHGEPDGLRHGEWTAAFQQRPPSAGRGSAMAEAPIGAAVRDALAGDATETDAQAAALLAQRALLDLAHDRPRAAAAGVAAAEALLHPAGDDTATPRGAGATGGVGTPDGVGAAGGVVASGDAGATGGVGASAAAGSSDAAGARDVAGPTDAAGATHEAGAAETAGALGDGPDPAALARRAEAVIAAAASRPR